MSDTFSTHDLVGPVQSRNQVSPNSGLLWSVQDLSHDVDYGQFTVVEDGSDEPDLVEDGPEEPEWLTSGEGWLAVLSGGSGHHPTITLEAWSRTPPTPERHWDVQREVEVTFSEDVETLRIWGTASGPSRGPSFVLPPSDSQRYQVRVSRSGGTADDTVADQVIDLVANDEYEDGIFGLEEWLFQFWPQY